ncbi:MAG: prephenate dehydratase [Desulfobulbus propionicus]|nr:MAG: prephenate dehydratase [Desulfobulbus propionicus]
MVTVATLGPWSSLSCQAARQFRKDGEIALYNCTRDLLADFTQQKTDYAVVPVYNTREGEVKHTFALLDRLKAGYWTDNILVHSDLSLAVLHPEESLESIELVIGTRELLGQCNEYIDQMLPSSHQMVVRDMETAVTHLCKEGKGGIALVGEHTLLVRQGLSIIEREVAPHNRTRFAVLGHRLSAVTGYDATTLVTAPLPDRVGLLVDMLREFTRRGINILDMRSDNDIKTQKLQIYLEAEGHIQSAMMKEAIADIESQVIKQRGALRVLGSFPRIDMRTKHIQSIGFIGTGAMSQWFADRLKGEGYEVVLSGRSTSLRPEKMLEEVDVVVICVPISVTVATVQKFGPLIGDGKALLLLAGESEGVINAALASTSANVEVMLIHNLWGPQTVTMKDKNAIVVRTAKSGLLCSELEAFLYKLGADIFHDSPAQHDLLMGIGQKLPTAISVALAMTLKQNNITSEEIASHCTLTSLYPLLAMARVHSQNPRTYAEILSSAGSGHKIVDDFHNNLDTVIELTRNAAIDDLCQLIEKNISHLKADFLEKGMKQAKAVDEVLGKMT